MYLLETARSRGVRFESARVTGVDVANGRINGVRLSSGERVDSPIFINAAGPYLKDVGKLLGVDLPVHTELHLKAAIKDPLGVVGRDAPLLIWNDAQNLPWEDEEREALAEDEETRWLTNHFQRRSHSTRRRRRKPDDLDVVGISNESDGTVWPPKMDEQYPEVALRGLAAMLPRMKEYLPGCRARNSMVDTTQRHVRIVRWLGPWVWRART